ncbi:MAG: Asp-tRNA(Asn)/Glu-tRNA(Gln) amidotransferase subunit GatC [Myxococcales bacterium]|nr:Asp-tRNA(Asn)/Glu-tRNA(Gln) amidotransferase subunit GatC [Myxococcales bacterium]MCB9577477.1 Asp-tRNA(Asn)/Glu-tRNA(Gln) amidotransferase subunit GatC [Polyangiaceae bacterium]
MALSRDQLRHLARLARIDLDDAELRGLEGDLEQILGYVELLQELSTDDVQPTAQVAVAAAPLRDDVPLEGLSTADALSEAPRLGETSFAVPAIIDEP